MFHIVTCYFRFSENRSLVVETAPNQTTREKLELLKQAGVSRISMGIQSFSDKELSVLGRQHNAEKARQAFALIKTYDFPCVNVDFIYGIPGQTAASLLESLKEALQFEPEEIFLYPLYVKHGARMEREGVVLEPETAFAQYQAASSFLRGNDTVRIPCVVLCGRQPHALSRNVVLALLLDWAAVGEVIWGNCIFAVRMPSLEVTVWRG